MLFLCLSAAASCGTINPAVVSCAETVGKAALAAAVDAIVACIEAGAAGGLTVAQILASLEHVALSFAPDVWACAMQQVSAGHAPDSSHASFVATVAADYLAGHK
jgi:hypothetical protein